MWHQESLSQALSSNCYTASLENFKAEIPLKKYFLSCTNEEEKNPRYPFFSSLLLFFYLDILSWTFGPIHLYISAQRALLAVVWHLSVDSKSIIMFMFICFCYRQHLRAGWILCMQLSIPEG